MKIWDLDPNLSSPHHFSNLEVVALPKQRREEAACTHTRGGIGMSLGQEECRGGTLGVSFLKPLGLPESSPPQCSPRENRGGCGSKGGACGQLDPSSGFTDVFDTNTKRGKVSQVEEVAQWEILD